MRRNFQPGLRRDLERLATEPVSGDSPPPLVDETAIVQNFEEAVAADEVKPFKLIPPAPPAVPGYPLQLPPSSE
jgi:hypothetical protein